MLNAGALLDPCAPEAIVANVDGLTLPKPDGTAAGLDAGGEDGAGADADDPELLEFELGEPPEVPPPHTGGPGMVYDDGTGGDHISKLTSSAVYAPGNWVMYSDPIVPLPPPDIRSCAHSM